MISDLTVLLIMNETVSPFNLPLYDVVIIGGGLTGLAAAVELSTIMSSASSNMKNSRKPPNTINKKSIILSTEDNQDNRISFLFIFLSFNSDTPLFKIVEKFLNLTKVYLIIID